MSNSAAVDQSHWSQSLLFKPVQLLYCAGILLCLAIQTGISQRERVLMPSFRAVRFIFQKRCINILLQHSSLSSYLSGYGMQLPPHLCGGSVAGSSLSSTPVWGVSWWYLWSGDSGRLQASLWWGSTLHTGPSVSLRKELPTTIIGVSLEAWCHSSCMWPCSWAFHHTLSYLSFKIEGLKPIMEGPLGKWGR